MVIIIDLIYCIFWFCINKINSNIRSAIIDDYIVSITLEGYLVILEKKTGKIKVLIGDGSAGFISSSGDDYYFTFANLNFNGESVEIGLEVSFFLEKSFDIKKKLNKTDYLIDSVVEKPNTFIV